MRKYRGKSSILPKMKIWPRIRILSRQKGTQTSSAMERRKFEKRVQSNFDSICNKGFAFIYSLARRVWKVNLIEGEKTTAKCYIKRFTHIYWYWSAAMLHSAFLTFCTSNRSIKLYKLTIFCLPAAGAFSFILFLAWKRKINWISRNWKFNKSLLAHFFLLLRQRPRGTGLRFAQRHSEFSSLSQPARVLIDKPLTYRMLELWYVFVRNSHYFMQFKISLVKL